MKIDRKITLRGMVIDVIVSNGWDGDALDRFKRLCTLDPSGMAATWLKGNNRPYHKNYISHMNKARRVKL